MCMKLSTMRRSRPKLNHILYYFVFVFFQYRDLSELASSFVEAERVPLKLMLVQDTALLIPLWTYCPKILPKDFYVPGPHPYALNTINFSKLINPLPLLSRLAAIKIIIKIHTTLRELQIRALKLAIFMKRHKLFCVNFIFCESYV